MVLNDVFDVEADARDFPERPVPSGRISLRAAKAVGWAMLASGVLAAWFVGYWTSDWRPGAVSTLLGTCIVLYDAVLKRTPLAPVAMGACRLLNVLLGMSLAGAGLLVVEATSPTTTSPARPWFAAEWLIALGVGIYIAGVTLFSRTDAVRSSRWQLTAGLAVLLSGIALLAAVPALTDDDPPLVVGRTGWYLLWGALALITARRCVLAINEPTPQRVQAAVRHGVQSIIVLDAAVCIGYVGPMWGLAVFTLIFPTLLLAGWLKAT
jgi:4-hydroxybenzoate polyprenyltransferase